MKDDVDKIAQVEAKLDTLIRLFAMTMIKDIEHTKDKAILLSKAGLGAKEIAALCDTTRNTVKMAMADNTAEMMEDLIAIKRLLVFALLQQPGITQGQIATALGASQAQISRMMAGGKAK